MNAYVPISDMEAYDAVVSGPVRTLSVPLGGCNDILIQQPLDQTKASDTCGITYLHLLDDLDWHACAN